jgi:urease accessory protein
MRSSPPLSVILTQRLHHDRDDVTIAHTLWLTAEERTRSRHQFTADDGTPIYLQLPRGTLLQDRDILTVETGEIAIEIAAKPEPVLTVSSNDSIDLLRASYHLGNRHVSLEITPTYLRLSPDPVLARMLVQLGLEVIAEVAPFRPQGGAYSHQH